MAKKETPAVSPAETEILRLVWQLEPATVQDICEALSKDREVNYARATCSTKCAARRIIFRPL
jgi:predicted transcriptional regulator